MRLAYITGRYPAVTHTFILREVHALRRMGFEVKCFSIWPTPEADLLSELDRDERRDTDTLLPPTAARLIRSHSKALRSSPRAYLTLARRAVALSSPGLRRRAVAATWFLEAIMLWEACLRSGVRHIHAQLDGTAPMVAMLTAEFGQLVDGTAGPWSWSHRLHGSKEFYEIHPERLARRAESASFIACISDYTRSQVMAFVPEELWDKLLVVRCGVNPDEFVPSRREGQPLKILTVGRVDAMKGTVVLLQALAELSERGLDPQLTIVGDGPSKDKAVAFAQRLGLGDRVTWAGAVGQDRIRDFYAECDIFCLPSFAEGVPIVLMEALAMEIPVVANAITGIVELVQDEVSGFLVRPGRVDQLTDRLEQLLRDSDLRHEMGRAGRRKVQAEYDLEHNVSDLARLFRSTPAGPMA